MGRAALVAGTAALSLSSFAIVRHVDVPESAYADFGSQFTAVGEVTSGGSGGTGTLVASNWVLTAAHVVDGGGSKAFHLGGQTYNVAEVVLRSNSWTLENGLDLALVRLTTDVAGVTPMSFYREPSVIGLEGVGVGFGYSGTGVTGYQWWTGGSRLAGTNMIDQAGGFGLASSVLLADFDSGSAGHNRMGSATRTSLEFSLAPGDSGGPLLINDGGTYKIAGAASFIWGRYDGSNNSSYGDLMGWHGTYAHQEWIDQTAGVPEPATLTLLGLGALVALRRKRASK